MTDIANAPTPPASAADALVERLFQSTLHALELLSVQVGWRLGLYAVLASADDDRGLTVGELATLAGIDTRYAQEWLEQQAVAGMIAVDGVDADPADRRFSLPDGFAEVLVDPESPAHVVPFAGLVTGIAGCVPDVVEAFRTGAGVPFARYGDDMRDGQGAINRPAFHHEMGSWLSRLPDIDARLHDGGTVVDLGCGQGWSTIAIARAHPGATVIGIDSDEASITDARNNAEAAEVTVRFELADGATSTHAADLVCIFEALHDMSDPVGLLTAARGHLSPGGCVLVADERVQDAFTAPGDEIERMMYGWSVLHCLPASRAETPSAALGTVLRRPVVERLAADAGFASVEVVDIDNDFLRFYRLQPA